MTELEAIEKASISCNKSTEKINKISLQRWIHGGEAVRRGLVEVIKQVWKEGIIPRDWRKSVVVPIFKKRDQEKMENYRRVSLLCTGCKIYAEVLRIRLEEVERLDMIPEIQEGFRKGRGTVENIYILEHLVQRKGGEKEKKVYAFFVDLEAAFDNVEREKLWEILERKGVKRNIIGRLRRIYEETRSVVRTEEGLTKEFTQEKE